jgi:hypothetical protein
VAIWYASLRGVRQQYDICASDVLGRRVDGRLIFQTPERRLEVHADPQGEAMSIDALLKDKQIQHLLDRMRPNGCLAEDAPEGTGASKQQRPRRDGFRLCRSFRTLERRHRSARTGTLGR